MNKIAVGSSLPKDVIDLDAAVEDNIKSIAEAKKVKISEVTALCIRKTQT